MTTLYNKEMTWWIVASGFVLSIRYQTLTILKGSPSCQDLPDLEAIDQSGDWNIDDISIDVVGQHRCIAMYA